MTATMERRYQLTRICSGDYVFPSNDGRTLWRVSRYEEDGSLETDEGRVVRGTFWRAGRFNGSLERADALMRRDPDEFLSWASWIEWDSLLPTREAALDAALKAAATMLEP